jgi:hypothetical protein
VVVKKKKSLLKEEKMNFNNKLKYYSKERIVGGNANELIDFAQIKLVLP